MSRIHLILLFILICVFTGEAGAEPLVHYADGKLTLDVQDTELSGILEVIERQGVRVYIGEGVNPIISATFNKRPIEQAFNAILKNSDYSLIWRNGGDGEIRLEEIQVFGQGKAPTVHRVHSGGLDVVAGKDNRLMVRDTVLLMFEKGVAKGRIESLVARYNGILVDFDEQRGIALIRLPQGSDPEEVSQKILQTDLVLIAEPDYVFELPRPARPGGIPLSTNSVSDQKMTDSGVRIAVLDSGLAAEYQQSSFLAGTYDALSSSRQIFDDSGHGTQMALIASGIVDPIGTEDRSENLTSVLAVRAFDHNGFTSTSTLMNGIDYALESGARIVSMSWGSDTNSQMLETVIDYASDKGLVLVAAVGNEPTGIPVYPAAYENVIGIGALLPDNRVWPDSNYGDFVDAQYPGLARFSEENGDTYGMYAGTSISTAYASRKIAEILEREPGADIDQILGELLKRK